MAEYVQGFAELVAHLRAAGTDPGEPLADEYQSGPTTRQPTSFGELIWTPGGAPLYLKGETAP
jgi:hypothetical protein